jgi:hypothetical protein
VVGSRGAREGDAASDQGVRAGRGRPTHDHEKKKLIGDVLPDEEVDRLAGLLPTDALEDALEGLEPEEIMGPGGLLGQLAGRVIETALGAELTGHLGYPPGQAPPGGGPNVRNGSTPKTVGTELAPVGVRTPRDRDGSFEPQLVGKRQTSLAGLDERVLDLSAGGMSVRDIAAQLSGLYGVEVGRDTISRVTDAVLEDVVAWRSRALEAVYPIVYFDCLMVKIREDRSVRSRACYLAVRRHRRGGPRAARDLVAGHGGRQVLARGAQRPAPARHKGRTDLLRRRPDWVPRGDRGRLPPGVGADLHRPPDPLIDALRQLPRPPPPGEGPAAGLHRPQRRRCAGRTRAL